MSVETEAALKNWEASESISCDLFRHFEDVWRLTIFDFATKLIQTYRAKQGGAA